MSVVLGEQILTDSFLREAARAVFKDDDFALENTAQDHGVILSDSVLERVNTHLKGCRKRHQHRHASNGRVHHNEMIAALIKAAFAIALTIILSLIDEFASLGAVATLFFVVQAFLAWKQSARAGRFGVANIV